MFFSGPAFARAACLLAFASAAAAAPPVPFEAVKVAGSLDTFCAVKGDGTVWCWGSSEHLGLGSLDAPDPARAAVQVPGVSGAIDIASGFYSFCALIGDGTVKCWGRRVFRYPAPTYSLPVEIGNVNGAVAIASGYDRACAAMNDGTLKCWGDLANPDGTAKTVPGISGVTDVAVGLAYICVIADAGKVKCGGNNGFGQLGDGTTESRDFGEILGTYPAATSVAAGRFDHTCATFIDQSVRCWGNNTTGTLGDGTTIQRLVPTLVPGIAATKIEAGFSHTCAVTAAGGAACWGSNNAGQLGDGTTTSRVSPVPVATPPGTVSALAIAFSTTCGVVSGLAQCWGANGAGLLGDNRPNPRMSPVTPAQAGIVQLSGGLNHSCAIVSGGAVACWGSNAYGELGDGGTVSRFDPAPVPGISGAAKIVSGDSHTCALVAGTVQCWGRNTLGQTGGSADELSPVTVLGISGATDISATGARSCALVAGGEMHCWGGTFAVRPQLPAAVPGIANAVALFGDCAKFASGEVRCGATAMPSLAGAISIGVAEGAVCAVMPTGAVHCTGGYPSYHPDNISFTGSTWPSADLPAIIPGILDATAIAANRLSHCAITGGGRITCWGLQIVPYVVGAGVFFEVPGITTAVALWAGQEHMCAGIADGATRCWGASSSGQLGDGTGGYRTTPGPVLEFTRTATSITLSPALAPQAFPEVASPMTATVSGTQSPQGDVLFRVDGLESEVRVPIRPDGTASFSLPAKSYATGVRTVAARYEGDAAHLGSGWSSDVAHTIVKGTQSIIAPVPALADRFRHLSPFLIASILTNRGYWAYVTSLTPSICTTSQDGVFRTTVTLLGMGMCQLEAGHPGNAGYEAAASVAMSFQVLAPAITTRRASDADGSSSTDIFWTGAGGEAALWLMNGASIGASAVLIGPGGGWTLSDTKGDFNGDGRSDILWRHVDGRWAIWLMDGTTAVGSALVLGPATGWEVTHVDDFDGDGRSDLLWRNADGSVAMWTMNGVAASTSAMLFGPGSAWRVTHTADLDGDGRADFVWRNATGGAVSAWLMNGLAPVSTAVIYDDSPWSVTHTGDFNGDGRKDLAWRNPGSGQVALWLMNGLIRLSSGSYGIGTSVLSQVADFDFNGKSDLLITGADGSVSIWLMDGTDVASSAVIFGGGNGWVATHVGDFDGDGPADILWRDAGGRIALWTMNGLAVLTSSLIFGGGGWVPAP